MRQASTHSHSHMRGKALSTPLEDGRNSDQQKSGGFFLLEEINLQPFLL